MRNQIADLSSLNNFKKYFYNTSFIFAEQGLKIISVLIINFILARYLGVESFGVLNYSMAITMLFCNSIAKLGIEEILVKEYISSPKEVLNIIGTAFWLRTAGALLSLLLVLLYSYFDEASYRAYFLILSALPFLFSTEVVEYYFQSQLMAKYISICRMISFTQSILVKLILIYYEMGLIWIVASYVLDQFIHTSSLLVIYHSMKIGNFFRSFNVDFAKRLLQQSWPMIITNISIMLYMRIDQVMIKEMMSIKDVGYYSAAIRISESWYFVPTLLTASLFPAILNAKLFSHDLYENRLKKLMFVLFWFSALSALFLSFFSEKIITLIYGIEYIPSAEILAWHVWTGVFVAIGVTNSKWIVSENLQHKTYLNTVVGAISNIGLNLVLIPKYGLKGAAFSTFVSNALSTYLMLFMSKETRPRFYSITRSIFYS